MIHLKSRYQPFGRREPVRHFWVVQKSSKKLLPQKLFEAFCVQQA